ncbi:MAG: DUF2255 family protein [Myxococcota bacterium]
MPHRPRFARLAALLGGLLLLSGSGARALERSPTDWSSLADVQEIQVLSENADGTPHETTVWLAVVDQEGFIRTGNTSWYPNLERKPEIAVRIAGKEYAVRAVPIEDEALRERVFAAFRAKYGWSDRMVGWFFPGRPHIVRLAPR